MDRPTRRPPDRASLAAMLDHTLLAPEADAERVTAFCVEAVQLGVTAVCVSPRWVRLASAELSGTAVDVAAVVGFPSGAHRSLLKASEARLAIDDGARELDMVVSLGDVFGGDWGAVAEDIVGVRARASDGVLLKVIIESALLSDGQIDDVCRVAVDAGADYVKTSTGFHPSGGASIDAVRRMRVAVGPDVGIKASGGIRDTATALAMIEAGATRIGASASAAILAPLD